MIKELTPDEFTDRLLPIFKDVHSQIDNYYAGDFNPGFFFPVWQNYMKIGIARTWEQGPGDAVIGVIFHKNTFTKSSSALVHFWFKRKDAPSALPLLEVAEKAAREENCVSLQSAAYAELNGDSMEEKYKKLGFEISETIFRKVL